MGAKDHSKRRNISLGKASVLIAVLILQIVRICGSGFLFYYQFNTIIIKQDQALLLDEVPAMNESATEEVITPSKPSLRDNLLKEVFGGDEEEEPDMESFDQSVKEEEAKMEDTSEYIWQHAILSGSTCAEVLMTILFIWFLLGPLSKKIPLSRWLKWLVGMRIFWMRLIWTATAITYSVVVVYYKDEMYNLEDNPEEKSKFKVDNVWISMLVISCFEYLFLGCLECFFKMMTSDKILSKIEDRAGYLPRKWKKLEIRTYYLCLFAYAARNFSLSLYFGLLSVFISFDDLISKNLYAGPTVVLQIYLAMVRGRFYGLFMHAFLSIFLVEDDDAMFKELQEDEESKDANGDAIEKMPLTNETRFRNVNSEPYEGVTSKTDMIDSRA